MQIIGTTRWHVMGNDRRTLLAKDAPPLDSLNIEAIQPDSLRLQLPPPIRAALTGLNGNELVASHTGRHGEGSRLNIKFSGSEKRNEKV